MSTDHDVKLEAVLRVMSPTLRAASHVIERLTDGISMRRQINVSKTLDEAERVVSSIRAMTHDLNALLGVRDVELGEGTSGEEFINRVHLLAYLNGLPGLRGVGKARMNPDGLGFELVLYYYADIWHVLGSVITVNADATYDAPGWLKGTMVDMGVEMGHERWSSVSAGQFMGYSSPYLRGLKE